MGSFCSDLKFCQLDQLIEEAQQEPGDDSPQMNEIIRRFDPKARQLARSLSVDPNLSDDLANCARIGLVAAVRRHDPGRPGFPAYAVYFMRGGALRELKRLRRNGRGGAGITVSPTDFADAASEGLVPLVQPFERVTEWGSGATADAVASLTAAQQDLLRRRYVNDDALHDIGAPSGVTPSAVRQRLMTAHRAITRQLAA
jgi:RNA polymerase sigma factor (sigma-70 family)